MVVKEKVGRRRYILFRLDSDVKVHTGDMIKALVHRSDRLEIDRRVAKPWLIDFVECEENRSCIGILRCTHRYQKEYTEILNSIDKLLYKKVDIQTLSCSGTLKTVRKKMAELQQEMDGSREQ